MTEDESRQKIVAQQMLLPRECLADADAAAVRGSARLAWNRAYYACFHTATAVFVGRNRRFTKHRGIIKAVHEELVPEGVLSPELAVSFDGLYAQRLDREKRPKIRSRPSFHLTGARPPESAPFQTAPS
jgi:uncharacterized protein (UPF0332 family)